MNEHTPNRTRNPRSTQKPKRVAGQKVCQTQRNKKVGEAYRLRRVDMVFEARHGHRLDPDNAFYCAKPVVDALVNLGFIDNDKDLQILVRQETKHGAHEIVSHVCEGGRQ